MMNSLIWLMTTPRPLWLRLLLAIGIAAAALATRTMLQIEPGSFPFLTFSPAVVFATLLPGLWPGLLCLLISIALAWQFTLLPTGMTHLDPSNECAGLGVFALMGLAFIFGSAAIKNGIAVLSRRNKQSAAQVELSKVLLQALRHCVWRYLTLATETLQKQRGLTPDVTALAVLDGNIERLDALDRLYRRLHGQDHVGSGAVEPFLENICRDLLSPKRRAGLRCLVRADGICLPSEHKVAVGLIVTELMTGALEAWPARSGSLEIELRAVGEGHCRLTFRDGRTEVGASGPPSDCADRLALTELLIRLLGGRVLRSLDDGRTVVVEFPIQYPPA